MPAAVRAAFGLEDVPYLVCIGRVDDQKGTGMLWRFFRAYKQRHPGPLRLVFVGQVVDTPEASEDIVLTGMVDDAAKWALLRGAQVHVAPSPHESFSLTVIEALTAGVPVLVNAVCGATREHCEQSGAGLWFSDFAEFEAALRLLTTDAARHETMRRQRAPLRGGQLHLAGDPGPLLLVPGALHRSGCGSGRRSGGWEGRPVAVQVGFLGERLPAGRAQRLRADGRAGSTATGTTSGGRPRRPDSSSPPRTGSVVSVEPRPSAWAASKRFCTAGKTEASMACA